ncbi:MAG: hypothetical protein WC372_05395 [Candidatus Neomarinimicrobiota bacterium]|nr:hypothetical protein [Candidatus Neomarinimicrobiota bacterium]MDD3966903.1 hypothetical protein [Candidatus Neomarinimicrobiota bacterium]
MNPLRASRHLLILLCLLPALLPAAYRSYGNDHLNLLQGPGAVLYGTAYGLMQQGSENTLINPAGLQLSAGKPLYLYHASWFRNEVTASSLAYTLNYRQKAMGLMVSRIGVSDIPDSRNALLDYGLDGIPGTGDSGEGNGILDENEILDHDNIRYSGIANYALHLGMPLLEKGNFRGGMSLGLLYSDLMISKGFGMTLDLYAELRGKHVQSLYAVKNLPSAIMIFSNGSAQYYPPQLRGAWLFPIKWNAVSLSPGISASMAFAENLDYYLLSLGRALALDIQPLLRLQYRDVLAAGISYRFREGLHAGIEILLPLLDIAYTFRPSVNGDLGSSHLFSLRLSTDIFK